MANVPYKFVHVGNFLIGGYELLSGIISRQHNPKFPWDPGIYVVFHKISMWRFLDEAFLLQLTLVPLLFCMTWHIYLYGGLDLWRVYRGAFQFPTFPFFKVRVPFWLAHQLAMFWDFSKLNPIGQRPSHTFFPGFHFYNSILKDWWISGWI